MKKSNKIRVIAANNYKVESKFDIYLEFPGGRRKWLMMHRHNGILFNMLRNGIGLDELRRFKGRDQSRVGYLIRVIDEFLEEEMSA